jgi:hypothetical protein
MVPEDALDEAWRLVDAHDTQEESRKADGRNDPPYPEVAVPRPS